MEKNYKDTLNLPKTSFPMKANLPVKEPEIQAYWEKIKLYEKIRQERKGAPGYILHDGPPYANGSIHIGTALNKILKDFIIKARTMSGFDAPYVPGWDCHGLPIELQALKKLGVEASSLPPYKIRRKCRQHAEKFVKLQRKQFKRLGVFGQWEDPYLTMAPEYEAAEIDVFKKLWSEGYVYRGLRPIHWCGPCATALAEAEIEYADRTSPSIYIKFKLNDSPEEAGGRDVNLLVWTTTPWTLVANSAIAAHPDVNYVFFESNKCVYAVAEELFEKLAAHLGFSDCSVIFRKKGSELEGLSAGHPFIERDSPVVCADFVSHEEGTGFVHSAPGHGREDFEMGARLGLPVRCPVDNRGNFTAEAGDLEGMNVFAANGAVIEKLSDRGALVLKEDIVHSYPNCWRCKQPLLTRTTEQWFVSVSKKGLRKKLLDEIEKVNWLPGWGKTRIRSMTAERPDWCISRQRLWGVPIPVFHCRSCNNVIASEGFMDKISDLFSREGSDVWFEKSVEELAGSRILCDKCGGSDISKETDIFDVWFDSGVSWHAVLNKRDNLSFPADLYLEGTDQHRGWFQTSLIVSSAAAGAAPYKNVLTHGFMVDGEGKKMSKSIGNLIEAGELVDKYGADVLRLWVSAEDYTNDIRFSAEILSGISESYRRFRNTVRYILGNLPDFDFLKDGVPYSDLPDMEKWVLHKLQIFLKTTSSAYENFEFHKVYRAMQDFCSVCLSAFYFDIIKDRLYTLSPKNFLRRASQTVMYEIFDSLIRTMAPILPHSAEESWQHFEIKKDRRESVHLESTPLADEKKIDEDLARRWEILSETRKTVNKELENARDSKKIGNSLQAKVLIKSSAQAMEILRRYELLLPEIFIVSEVILEESENGDMRVEVKKTDFEKCPRCWKYSQSTNSPTTQSDVCALCARALEEAR